MNKPVVFLIEEDNESRLLFRQLLKSRNYQVALAIDKEDATERVGHGVFKLDLIMVNLRNTAPEKMLEFARGLCQEANLNVPVIAIANNYDADLEGKNIKVNEDEYIVYLEEANQLFDLMSTLLEKHNTAI